MDNSAQSSNPNAVPPTPVAGATPPQPEPSSPVTPPTPAATDPQPTSTPAPAAPSVQETPPPTPTPADPPAAMPPADPPAPTMPADPPAPADPAPVPTTPSAQETTPPAPTPADPPAATPPADPPSTPPSATPEATAPTVTPTPAPTVTPEPTVSPAAETKPADTNPSASLSGSQTPPPPMQPQAKHWHISPWTILLILVLLGFSGFFAYIAFSPKVKSIPTAQQTITPVPTPVAQSILALAPAPAGTEAAKPGVQTYNVTIDTGTNIVNAVQLDLAYDPTVLMNVTVTPGTFFTNPSQLMNDIDTKNGRISYALGIQPKDKGIKGTGVVAQLMFQFQPTATVSSTMIKFLPKTLVAGQGINPSVLKSATDATIAVPLPQGTKTLSQPTTAPATTPAAQ